MMRVLFLCLGVFSSEGGIERFNRAFTLAASELGADMGFELTVISLMDTGSDPRYTGGCRFRGFGGSRLPFALGALREGLRSDLVVLGHINLAPVGLALSVLRPAVKLAAIAHGIEVWGPLPWMGRSVLKRARAVVPVSEYTRGRLMSGSGVEPGRITVLPNTLDPYLELPVPGARPAHVLERHGIAEGASVVLTVSRLSSSEGYKGYDRVIRAMPAVLEKAPGARYLIVGRADGSERERVEGIVRGLGLGDVVTLVGFVGAEELGDYYAAADVFAMPSRGEGFGIVFLEALACGKPVIAGSRDASREALQGGELGLLVDPDDVDAIAEAITRVLGGGAPRVMYDAAALREKTIDAFGFERFRTRVGELLGGLLGGVQK